MLAERHKRSFSETDKSVTALATLFLEKISPNTANKKVTTNTLVPYKVWPQGITVYATTARPFIN